MCIYHTIDFSINGLSTENRLRSQRTPTPYKIKANNCKLTDLVIKIELTGAISMPYFSNFLRNSIIHFPMLLYLVSHVAHRLYKRFVFQFQLVTRDEIVRPCDQHINETGTLRNMLPESRSCLT